MTGPSRALVLAGGGLKVAAQAGVLQVWLDEAGVEFAHADGASGGTLNLAMWAQGMSGSAIADNWRGYSPLRTLAPSWPGVLAGPWASSLLSLDRLRDVQLPRWGIDWERVRASPRSATFNVYDFAAHELLRLPAAAMDADTLMACVALPGWFPPVRRGRRLLIDSVYATDANLHDAIRHGADELWVVWTVDRRGRWRRGLLADYFQVVEASANSRLAAELETIEENNAEVAAGRSGTYGRPITVRLLALDVGVHYLFVFRRRALAAAVELGVAQARAWCDREGVARTPASSDEASASSDEASVEAVQDVEEVPGLRFEETMSGMVRFVGSTTAAAGGPLEDHRLTLRLHVAVADLEVFLRDPHHRAALTGEVVCDALGGRLPVSGGTLDLLTLDDAGVTTMRYRLTCTDPHGRELVVDGHKTLQHDAELDLWPDTTTLATSVTGPDQTLLAAGDVHLTLTGLLRLVTSLRGPRAGVRRLGPPLRFGRFFLGRLARVYLAPVTRGVLARSR